MSVGRRFALTATTQTLPMIARPMDTMVRPGSPAGSSSAQVPGTTALDARFIRGPTLAALSDVATKDAGSADAGLKGMVPWLRVASDRVAHRVAFTEAGHADGANSRR